MKIFKACISIFSGSVLLSFSENPLDKIQLSFQQISLPLYLVEDYIP